MCLNIIIRQVFTLAVLCTFQGGINTSIGQCSFRIKTVNSLQFLIPPHSKLSQEGIFGKKDNTRFNSRFRFHHVFITGIGNFGYYSALRQVEQAKYEHDDVPLNVIRLKSDYDITHTAERINSFTSVYFNDKANGFALEIDYQAIFDLDDKKAAFSELAISLLDWLQLKEKANPGWPMGICQDLLEQIFEMIPIPQDQALLRYMTSITRYKSVLLLNPKIGLLVDNTEKSRPKSPPNVNFWQFNLNGQTLVQFYRDDTGMLMQTPFLLFSKYLKLPDNFVSTDQPQNASLQASTADIQLSESTKNKKFLFLYQDNFKSNNQISANASCNNADIDNSSCTSLLLLSDSVDRTLLNSIIDQDGIKPSSVTTSSFGIRNLITPVITIFLNKTQSSIILNSHTGVLQQQNRIPPLSRYKVSRVYKGTYRKVENSDEKLILLPGDQINYQL